MDATLCARIDLRLREDPLGNIMALKFLSLKGGVAEGALIEDGPRWASWFGYQPQQVAFDAKMYAERERVVYWNANDAVLARTLSSRFPPNSVVKVSSQPCLDLARDGWPCVNSFLWFSANSPVSAAQGADCYDRVDEDLVSLSAVNGYDRAALREQEGRGCRWFVARVDGEPQALCFVQPNDRTVWEVSGVLVRPGFRGLGLAKAVVAAAVNDLLARGLTPRYFVHTENLASLGVVRSLGLVERGRTLHFLTPR